MVARVACGAFACLRAAAPVDGDEAGAAASATAEPWSGRAAYRLLLGALLRGAPADEPLLAALAAAAVKAASDKKAPAFGAAFWDIN